MLHALRRLALRGDLTPARGDEALGDLADMSITRYPHVSFHERIWELKGNLTAYDAAYVALAEALDAPLLTMDGHLARAPGLGARIELFPR